eukprot:2946234-Prymnesium_polylepis.1
MRAAAACSQSCRRRGRATAMRPRQSRRFASAARRARASVTTRRRPHVRACHPPRHPPLLARRAT